MLEYPQQRKIPEYFTKYKIAEFLLEDVPEGDITTECICNYETEAVAVIQAEEDIIFVGERFIYNFFDDKFECKQFVHDGDFVKNGGIIAQITGPAAFILTFERTLLNILQHLSGIATKTKEYADLAKPYNVKILDTRKTTPGLRLFEKYAVCCGGGFNHRLDLSSGILIKDNHIKAAGSIARAVNKVRAKQILLAIELETENIDEVRQGLLAGVDGFLLDNMSPEDTAEAVRLIRSAPNGESIFIEASGGMTIEKIRNYITTGINAISIGGLTHSVKGANIHIEFVG
jgi:nicotinate-nucleotide pyrophosphorylase (carboxylating)